MKIKMQKTKMMILLTIFQTKDEIILSFYLYKL